MHRISSKSAVGFIRVLKVDDIKFIAEFSSKYFDRINGEARKVRDVEYDQFLDAFGCQHRHMP